MTFLEHYLLDKVQSFFLPLFFLCLSFLVAFLILSHGSSAFSHLSQDILVGMIILEKEKP